MVILSIHLFIQPSRITSFLFPSYCIVMPVSCPEAFTRLLVCFFVFFPSYFFLKRGVTRAGLHTYSIMRFPEIITSQRKENRGFLPSSLLFYPICIPFLQWFMTWCIAVSYNPSIKAM
ncbi:hypothetical protein B9Z19DRAFT_1087350 [Tuber borchii]|uniref:Uncharacterized protein n=1 Tax=Tuber borchii TaxID=42251 RepID=A0A2T6ZN50_TUBBO|nr:hypothetical protein B9Z19DRAFT_1087350 [Tuber borchii]